MFAGILVANHDDRRALLLRLMRRIARCLALDGSYRLAVHMASGYGLRVNALDDGTEHGAVDLSLDEMDAIVASDDEWFDDLRVVDWGGRFAFGVIDSGTVFVEAPDLGAIVDGLPHAVVSDRALMLVGRDS